MKKLYTRRWAKALAWALLLVFLLLALAAADGARRADGMGLLYGEMSFAESFPGRAYADNCVFYLSRYIEWTGDVTGAADEVLAYCGDSFGFSIEEDGVSVATANLQKGAELSVSDGRADYGGHSYAVYGYINMPPSAYGGCYWEYVQYAVLSALGYWLYVIAALSGLLAAAMLAFLVLSAGRAADGIALRGLHRLPLEAFTLGTLFLAALLAQGCAELRFFGHRAVELTDAPQRALWLFALCALAVTAAARLRAKRLRESFFVIKLWPALPPALRLALCLLAYTLGVFVFSALAVSDPVWFLPLLLFAAAGVFAALWLCRRAKTLLDAGEALANGELTRKVELRRLPPMLRPYGENLNRVGDGLSAAVAERMKSERLKTELITNVSHDLKTPLTGIVSYVDLLKKQELPGEAAREYLAVLERQSAKLKKLTEDLLEASKAASGAIAVTPERLDAAELLSQCAGEYAQRLRDAGVEPVLSLPPEPVTLLTDGRLLSRVFDNLIGNAAKYALPGTRAYFDLVKTPAGVEFRLKNISREPLNIPAQELMERFVRGDAARSTEGSGLGLSIARSLTELLGGTFMLTLDGDLFKVTLAFPDGQGE